MTVNYNDELRLIITKRGEYVVPVSAALTWEQRYPGSTPPKGMKDHKFWPIPDGWVIARPCED